MKLINGANQVLQEFGGVLPDSLVSIEDAARELLSVRALELQKLGVSTSDITLTTMTITPAARDEAVSLGTNADIVPAFVVATPLNAASDSIRYKVAIIPPDRIHAYEGSRAVAFYGTPKRIMYAWDVWDCDESLTLYYDPIEDVSAIDTETTLTFPPGFYTMLVKKAALNIARVVKLKLAVLSPLDYPNRGEIVNVLSSFEASIAGQVADWEAEARKFRSLDRSQQPHLRRTWDEIKYSDFDNVTGSTPGDFTS